MLKDGCRKYLTITKPSLAYLPLSDKLGHRRRVPLDQRREVVFGKFIRYTLHRTFECFSFFPKTQILFEVHLF